MLPLAAIAAAAAEPFVLNASSTVALIVCFLVSSLAASAGVGGGAFFVPLYQLALRFSLKDSTVLSQCTIAAVSAASLLRNLPKRHPTNPDETLIAFPLLLAMTPALLGGVGIGVLLNVALPAWLITVMLVLLLLYMSTRTGQKGLQQWRSETAAKQQQQQAAAAEAESRSRSPEVLVSHPIEDDASAETPTFAKPRRKPYPWSSCAGVAAMWAAFALLQLWRQASQRCSAEFFAALGTQVVSALAASALCSYFCLYKPAHEAEGDAGLSAPLLASSTGSLSALLERRQHHQQASMAHLLLNALKVGAAGALAGVLGVGGGLLMAPMLLASGVHPQSTSATSNVLVLFSSSAAALAFLLEGRVKLNYAYVFCAVAGTASLAGLSFMGRLVKASGRPSIVVLLLAFIMGAGAVCSALFGHFHVTAEFKSIC